MSHSCHANMEPVTSPAHTIALRAKRPIRRGEELTIFYTDLLDSRHTRRAKIRAEWKFWCACVRCSDPAEFGSHFSSFQCGCGGYYHEAGAEDGEVTDSWRCSSCGQRADLRTRYEEADTVLASLPGQRLSLDTLAAVTRLEGSHTHFYLVTRANMQFIEQNERTSDR